MERDDADKQNMKSVPSSENTWQKGVARWLKLHISQWQLDLLVLGTTIKLLLFPAYRSTDFEVHRNWLAITHSLPISQWYFDTTSEWTLDYPPFFAYFEKALSLPAYLIDKKIVDLNNLGYSTWSAVSYQRSTVIFTELLLGIVLMRFLPGSDNVSMQKVISASLFLHPGFLIVDHIHFQYNGVMYGVLLWSILMARNGNKLTCGALFAILLNFKHIYMYLAPAYFVYLLRSFCMSPKGEILMSRFLALANIVIFVFIVSLGPFILMGQMPQLLSRLFPFTRGLNHAYWAANFWALVTAADRVLLIYVKYTGANVQVDSTGVASSSRGLVGDTVFAVLPNIKPVHTFVITVLVQLVFLYKLWRHPTYKSFLAALTLSGYTSFMFGWHVHEKAVMLFLTPLSLLASENRHYLRTFLIVSVAGIYSLFPLLFTPTETIIKLTFSVLWGIFTFRPLITGIYQYPASLPAVLLDLLENIYMGGFVVVQLFVMLFPLFMGSRVCVDGHGSVCAESLDIPSEPVKPPFAFLPLMLTSVYCAIGLTWGFIRLLFIYMTQKIALD